MDTPSGPPSILDSPTLARVERARLREEGSANGRNSPMNMSTYCPVSDMPFVLPSVIKCVWIYKSKCMSIILLYLSKIYDGCRCFIVYGLVVQYTVHFWYRAAYKSRIFVHGRNQLIQ